MGTPETVEVFVQPRQTPFVQDFPNGVVPRGHVDIPRELAEPRWLDEVCRATLVLEDLLESAGGPDFGREKLYYNSTLVNRFNTDGSQKKLTPMQKMGAIALIEQRWNWHATNNERIAQDLEPLPWYGPILD